VVAHLKRAGQLIGQIDMLIAAIALRLGNCTVVTNDKDFLVIAGLSVENWRATTTDKTP
jgi:tRNA(fMet)-specific endonuclease VapC